MSTSTQRGVRRLGGWIASTRTQQQAILSCMSPQTFMVTALPSVSPGGRAGTPAQAACPPRYPWAPCLLF